MRVSSLLTVVVVVAVAGEASDAALALSFVDDAVVVRYLKEILSVTQALDPIVIRGLRRIGNADAKSALVDSAQSDHDERAALAQDALRHFGRGKVKRHDG